MDLKKERKHKWWYAVWEFTHRDKYGNIIWQESKENALADEGELLALATFLQDSALVEFYLGLADNTPAEDWTLADLSGEPSGSGYGRVVIERSGVGWPTLEMDAGDYMATSKLVTFLAVGGTIGPVNIMFLTTVGAGTMGSFIAWATLSSPRTLVADESLGCKIKIKQK